MNLFVIGGVAVLFVAVFLFTRASISSLKRETLAYFPFDQHLPHAQAWSVIFFLMTIIVLVLFLLALLDPEYSSILPA